MIAFSYIWAIVYLQEDTYRNQNINFEYKITLILIKFVLLSAFKLVFWASQKIRWSLLSTQEASNAKAYFGLFSIQVRPLINFYLDSIGRWLGFLVCLWFLQTVSIYCVFFWEFTNRISFNFYIDYGVAVWGSPFSIVGF